MTRLLGLLIVAGIVMYLAARQMNQGADALQVPCKDIRRAVIRGNTDKLEKVMVSYSKDGGLSLVALQARAAECAEAGEITESQAEQFAILVLPQ